MPSFIHLYHVHTLPMLQDTLLPWVPSPPLAHIAIELTSPSLPEPSRPLPFPNPLILAHRSPQLNNQCQHGARPNNPYLLLAQAQCLHSPLPVPQNDMHHPTGHDRISSQPMRWLSTQGWLFRACNCLSLSRLMTRIYLHVMTASLVAPTVGSQSGPATLYTFAPCHTNLHTLMFFTLPTHSGS